MKLWGVYGVFLVVLLAGCGGGVTSATEAPSRPQPTAPSSTTWIPSSTDSFQWQFASLPIDPSVAASVYDLDAFDTTAATVSALHAQGKHVVCYVDTGSYETWRPDAAQFAAHPEIVGKAVAGWPNEYWLDVRRTDLLGPIFDARFDSCKNKGFDAVETDNVDGYANATGFPLSASDQVTFNTWLAQHVHARGLSIALKNDADQIPSLASSFDWAIEEECHAQGWCGKVAPLLAAGKTVVEIEYTDQTSPATFTSTDCAQARQSGAHTILKNRDLNAWVLMCP